MRAKYLPSLKEVPLSSIFYALSDPARLQIVLALLEQDELSCGEFECKVAKSTMSHHFKVLREAGLIQKRDEGTKQFNSLRRKEIEARCPGLLESILKSKSPR
jgi:DNA-binding transcriptional ArsR family regulator